VDQNKSELTLKNFRNRPTLRDFVRAGNNNQKQPGQIAEDY
jgi:hypothetical protein